MDSGDSVESSSSGESGSMVSWIHWHCSQPGNEHLLEIPEEYIEDDFNLTGLSQQVKHYSHAMCTILDLEDDDDDTALLNHKEIENWAIILYSLIHARFILTKGGLENYRERYLVREFGICPRDGCQETPLLPCGQKEEPGLLVKLYCPRCFDLYHPKSVFLYLI
jgi:casein kinase II subunit beta